MRELHDGRDDGLEPLEPLDVRRAAGFADLLRRMARTTFVREGDAIPITTTCYLPRTQLGRRRSGTGY
jgi:hypothetical protein